MRRDVDVGYKPQLERVRDDGHRMGQAVTAAWRASFARVRHWSRALKAEALALYFAGRDPRTPLHAKLLIVAVAAYAMSPIDLIPDFIPVLGYLDDLILVPAGIALAVRLVPAEVMRDCRARAAERLAEGRPRSVAAAVFIVCVWIATIGWLGWILWRWTARGA